MGEEWRGVGKSQSPAEGTQGLGEGKGGPAELQEAG